MAAKHLSAAAEKALRLVEDGRHYHDEFRRKVDDRYDAYEGVLKVEQDAATWTSKLHPPYINHIVETTLAGLVDDRLHFRVRPVPRMYDEGEFDVAVKGAKAHEILMRWQLRLDRFSNKQRDFALQNAIAGLTVAKTYWREDSRPRKRLAAEEDEFGNIRLVEVEETTTAYDGPCTEVVDVRDFLWDEAATSLDRASWVAHRLWYSFEELKDLQSRGFYTNVDQLKDATKGAAQDENSREVSREQRDRTRHRIEALEIWYRTPEGLRTVTVANGNVEIKQDRPNPFWHGKYPFTICSTQPGLFQLGGISQVEKIQHLQEAVWDLMNQTIDGVRLANNPIVKIATDVDDPNAITWEPGAVWELDRPDQAMLEAPDPRVGQVALPHIERMEQQMQNLAGSHPFTTTSEGRQTASTATEASLVTNIATRSIQMQKQHLYMAFEDIGQQRLELNQQFIRQDIMAEQIGLDSGAELVEISPLLLQPQQRFDMDPQSESLFRQERKAEQQAMLKMALEVLPVAAALAAQGAATLPNLDEYVKEFLKANDVEDPTRFFSARQAPAPTPQQGQQPAAEVGGGGVTAPQSIDAATSPSNEQTMNPAAAMQQLLAAKGGVANGGFSLGPAAG